MSNLAIIIPSVRGTDALPSLKSALAQEGFDSLYVIVAGISCNDSQFREACRNISPAIMLGEYYPETPIPPGKARNQCLDILDTKLKGIDYVLFMDDDIITPKDFAIILVHYIEKEKTTAAVMGRVQTCPRNYWTHVLDYSHFWWLQVKQDMPTLGWVGGGATLTAYNSIRGLRFNETLHATEDTEYFNRVSEKTKGSLGICSQTTCFHYHNRTNLKEVIRYQFENGKNSRLFFHSKKIGIRSIIVGLKDILAYWIHSFVKNWKYLIIRPHIVFGMAMSFFIFELGIQKGIYDFKKKRDFNTSSGQGYF